MYQLHIHNEKENTRNTIIAFIKKIMYLKRSSYTEVESFFNPDFNYLTKSEPQSKNIIFNFLDDFNNDQYQYEIEKIKTLQQTVYLVYLKCTNRSRNNMQINTLMGTNRILLIIEQLGTAYYIAEAIDFKNNETNLIYAVLEKFSQS